MLTPYFLELDDQTRIVIRAESAAHAINRALYKCRGRTVVRCFARSFGTSREVELGEVMEAGQIEFEVPPHEPVPLSAIDPPNL